MRRKIGVMLVIILFINTLPLNIVDGIRGTVIKVNAEYRSIITTEDIKKFKDQIAAGGVFNVILNEEKKVTYIGPDTIIKENLEKWEDIIEISVGWSNIVGLKSDGTVVSTGWYNQYGENNVEDWVDIVQVAAGTEHSVGVKSDGTVIAVGSNNYGKCNVEDWNDIIEVSASSTHTVGLKSDGTVIATGSNNFGQCNVSEWKDIVQISTGPYSTVGLKSDGTVVTSGNNIEEQCNTSDWKNIIQISSGSNHIIGLKSDGTVVATGDNTYGQLDVTEWKDIVSIVASYSSTVALNAEGKIFVIGDNSTKAGGSIIWNEDIKKVSASYDHTVLLKMDGTVLAKGSNEYNKCDVSSWNNIKQVEAGKYNTLGLKLDGTVVAVGSNTFGRNNVNSWSNILQVSAGRNHSVGLKLDGTVLAVGKNDDYGQCNVEEWKDIVQVDAGENHTVALKSDGTVVATGRNYEKQCDVNTWTDIIKISAGERYTVGLKSNGTVVATGARWDGQCNVGSWQNIIDISAGTSRTLGLKSDKTVVGTTNNNTSETYIDKWTNIEQISTGNIDNIVAVKTDGKIMGTGNNSYNKTPTSIPYNDIVNIDKNIIKQGDSIKINIKSNSFYNNIDNNEIIIINNENYKLQKVNENEYVVNYTPKESGVINITLPGYKNIFGKSYIKDKIVKVLPLNSITTDKTNVNNGEIILIKANFTQPIKGLFTIQLTGEITSQQIRMKEVSGSNGKIYMASYVVPNTQNEGDVNIILNNILDSQDIIYTSYEEKGVFSKSKPTLPKVSITTPQSKYKIGDYIFVDVKFDKAVDTKNILIDSTGAINLNNLKPIRNDEYSATFKIYVNNNNVDGPLDIKVKNINNNEIENYEYTHKNLCEVYSLIPKVVEFKSSHTNAKLGDIVRFTASFNKSITEDVKITLEGDKILKSIPMKEVEGSNKTQYYYEYTVQDTDYTTFNSVIISDIEDFGGNRGSYSKKGIICTMDGQVPEVLSLQSNKEIYQQGDIISVTIKTNEAIKSGVKITLFDGDNILYQEALTEVAGQDKKMYQGHFIFNIGYSCNVDALVDNIEDEFGNTIEYRKQSLFKIDGDDRPVILGVKDIAIKIGERFDPLEGVSAYDTEDGDLINSVIITGEVDINKKGVYELIYSITDSFGSVYKVTREVKVGYLRTDINNDGSVDELDLLEIGNRYNTTEKNQGWYKQSDINQDGKVDILDCILVSKQIVTNDSDTILNTAFEEMQRKKNIY